MLHLGDGSPIRGIDGSLGIRRTAVTHVRVYRPFDTVDANGNNVPRLLSRFFSSIGPVSARLCNLYPMQVQLPSRTGPGETRGETKRDETKRDETRRDETKQEYRFSTSLINCFERLPVLFQAGPRRVPFRLLRGARFPLSRFEEFPLRIEVGRGSRVSSCESFDRESKSGGGGVSRWLGSIPRRHGADRVEGFPCRPDTATRLTHLHPTPSPSSSLPLPCPPVPSLYGDFILSHASGSRLLVFPGEHPGKTATRRLCDSKTRPSLRARRVRFVTRYLGSECRGNRVLRLHNFGLVMR